MPDGSWRRVENHTGFEAHTAFESVALASTG